MDKEKQRKLLRFKNHAKVDAKGKFIKNYVVTDASVHDSQALDALLNEKDKGQPLYADSACTGEDQENVITKNEMKNEVHEKGIATARLQKYRMQISR